jgi:hypothetical protein
VQLGVSVFIFLSHIHYEGGNNVDDGLPIIIYFLSKGYAELKQMRNKKRTQKRTRNKKQKQMHSSKVNEKGL